MKIERNSAAIVDFAGERRAVQITGADAHGLVVEPAPPVQARSRVTVVTRGQRLLARVIWRTSDAMGLLVEGTQSWSTWRAA